LIRIKAFDFRSDDDQSVKFGFSVAFLLAATACAHLQAGSGAERSEVVQVQVRDVLVELRHGSDDAEAAEQVKRVLPRAVLAAERWGSLEGPVAVTIHPTHDRLEAATGREGQPWMRAWARRGAVDLQSPRTWSRGSASDDALGQLLAHELTHCVLFHAVGPGWKARDIPLWFQEGMASVTAGERHARASADAISAPERMASSDAKVIYGTADRAFHYLIVRYGEDRVRLLLALIGEGRPFPVAFRDALGVPLAEFERDLRGQLAAVAARD
jgi:hypothetical protein